MTDAMRIADAHDGMAERFRRRVTDEWEAPRVVEFGTKRWASTPTHHRAWVPHAAEYVMSDVEDGTDVDVVVDLHRLYEAWGTERFDVAIACSVWEHLEHPWIAAREVHDLLVPGGLLLVATHHAFPVHGYPSDYTRWTVEGLTALMEWAGFVTDRCEYLYPCTITPPPEVTRWNPAAPAYLNVEGIWSRP